MNQSTDWLTTRQVATMLGMTPQKVRKLIEIGRLPAVNAAATEKMARWLIRREHLEAFLTPSNVPAPKAKPARRTRIDASVPKVF